MHPGPGRNNSGRASAVAPDASGASLRSVASGVAAIDMNKHLGSVLEKITLTLGGGSFTKSMMKTSSLPGAIRLRREKV